MTEYRRNLRLVGYLRPQGDNLFRVFCIEEGSEPGEIDLGNSALRHFVSRKGPIPKNDELFFYEVGIGAKTLYAFRQVRKTGDIRKSDPATSLEDRTVLSAEELTAFMDKMSRSKIKPYSVEVKKRK